MKKWCMSLLAMAAVLSTTPVTSAQDTQTAPDSHTTTRGIRGSDRTDWYESSPFFVHRLPDRTG